MTTYTDANMPEFNPAQICEDPHAYAVACCENGLLDKLPQLSFTPKTVTEAFLATLIAQPQNTQPILKYLWEANTHVSWDTQPILSRVAIVAPKLAPQIFAHVFETQPQKLKIFARNIAFQALRSETPHLLTTVLPYLSASSLRDLIKHACEHKQLPFAKTLIEVYPINESMDFLNDVPNEHRQEIEYVLSQMQSRRIHSSIEDASTPKRSKSSHRKM